MAAAVLDGGGVLLGGGVVDGSEGGEVVFVKLLSFTFTVLKLRFFVGREYCSSSEQATRGGGQLPGEGERCGHGWTGVEGRNE